MDKCIIFDVDGTLADVSHRRHLVRYGRRDWDKFFERMVDDPPIEGVCELANRVAWKDGKVKIIVVSGRPEAYYRETMDWLQKHVPGLRENMAGLWMRPTKDHRSDVEVKRSILKSIRKYYDPILVIDDRPTVIEMWKKEGLQVLQVVTDEWDGEKYEPGELILMVGPSGAGKDTFLDSEGFDSEIVVSSDDIRQTLCGHFMEQSKNNQVFAALHAIVKARIENGLDTLINATNIRNRDRRAILDLVPPNTKVHYFVIDRPLEEKHRDADWRDAVIVKGEKLIDYHHRIFQSNKKAILNGDGDPRVTVHTIGNFWDE